MEWNDRPSSSLERSDANDGNRNRYSREAGDDSRVASRGFRRRETSVYDTQYSSDSRNSQMRRRRRISEMDDKNRAMPYKNTRREIGQDTQESGESYRKPYQRDDERSFYKDQYAQVRESKRQRQMDGGEGPNSYRDQGYSNSRNPFNKKRKPNNGTPQKKAFHKKKQEKEPVYYDLGPVDLTEEVRLNKFLSNAGVCSRREADELIKVGAVVVNGLPVTELGTKISAQDRVEVNGREVHPERKVYILLNKPRNCVTTTDDPQERLTVTNLVRSACKERIYPVGRLDRNTTGVLLLTNDGDLAAQLVHPSFKKKKIYHVWLDKEVTPEDMQKIADGVELEDGEMHADAISYVSEEDQQQVGIEIHSGRNRIVRRIFEHLGYRVKKLDRVYFAGLTKKNLGRGKWRYLTQEEVINLKRGAFE